MLSTFLLALAVNLLIMFALDVSLNKRIHKKYLLHFVLTTPFIFAAALLLKLYPAYDWQFATVRDLNPALKIVAGLLIFDAFVFVMHKHVEHGAFWRWHKNHHGIVSNDDLTYYSPCPVGPEENFYYVGMQFLIPALLGMNDLEIFILITWIFQQGGYVHQHGLPELPWPFISPRHHRNHHFAPKTYYGGLFLFWDKASDIDPRAIHGFVPKRKQREAV